METENLVKLKMENSLDRDMISKLLDLIRKISDNVHESNNREYILKLINNDLETLKEKYKMIMDSINDLH